MDSKQLTEQLTYDKIKAACEAAGYAFFDNGDYNLNLGGIRCTTDTNLFDDLLYCAYRVNGEPVLKVWPATTDPGAYWLNNPMNSKGTAILIPGQYRGAYKIGPHGKSGYHALIQRGGSVSVYRDADRDNQHDMDPATEDNGYFGINIHRSNPFNKSYQIDKWSAGCQVHANVNNFFEMMELAEKAEAMYGETFTYTLFEAMDFSVPSEKISADEPVKCQCGKTKDHEGNCDGSHAITEEETPAAPSAEEPIADANPETVVETTQPEEELPDSPEPADEQPIADTATDPA